MWSASFCPLFQNAQIQRGSSKGRGRKNASHLPSHAISHSLTHRPALTMTMTTVVAGTSLPHLDSQSFRGKAAGAVRDRLSRPAKAELGGGKDSVLGLCWSGME